MNSLYWISIVVLLTFNISLQAQELQLKPCAEECYSFKFCKGTEMVVWCASNPYDVWYYGEQLRPYRLSNPSSCLATPTTKLRFVDENNNRVNFYAIGTDGERHDVFVIDQQVDDMQAGLDYWKNLCPPNPFNSKHCCVDIQYSDNANDFPLYGDQKLDEVAGNISIYQSSVLDYTTCIRDCPETGSSNKPTIGRIKLNITSQFLYGKANHPLPSKPEDFERMFYTGTVPPPEVVAKGRPKMISLIEIMAHEFGHIYGIRHPDDASEFYTGCESSCLPREDGIMGGYNVNVPPKPLSEAEICAFRKLYCPDMVGITSIGDVFSVPGLLLSQNYPNPVGRTTDYWTYLSFSVPTTMNIGITIQDITGRIYESKRRYLEQSGEYLIPIRAYGWPSGTYIYVIKEIGSNNIITMNKMQVLK